MRKNSLKAIVVAVGLVMVSGGASATWRDGYGVVRFVSTDQEKVIYSVNVNPYNNEASISTNKTNYDSYKNTTSSYPNRNFTPAGYLPGSAWTSDQLQATMVDARSTLIYKNVNTSTGAQCAQGKTCGTIGMTVGSGKCTTRFMNLGNTSPWMAPIRYLESLVGVSSATQQQGISTCTTSSIAHSCFTGHAATPSPTITYATVEHRAKWGYARLTTQNGTIWEGSNGQTVKNLCAAAGGTYRWDTIGGESYCTGVKDKVHFQRFEVFPVTGASTVASCRVTGNG